MSTLPVRVVLRSESSGIARFLPWLRTRRQLGSSILRYQLGQLIGPYLPDHFDVSFEECCPDDPYFDFDAWLRSLQPAIVILLKGVGYHMTEEQLLRLRERSISLGLDHKDGNLANAKLGLFDFHISSTTTGACALEKILNEEKFNRRPFVATLHQTYDMRLDGLKFRQLPRFAPVYIGMIKKAVLPEEVLKALDVLKVGNNSQMKRALKKLPNYNFHFNVRPHGPVRLRRAYVPFTKGFTAAACRSNILIGRNVDDAEEFLTPNYPYFLNNNSREEISSGLEKAREEFGGPEWNRGLQIMAEAKERVSGPVLANQFVSIVTRAFEESERSSGWHLASPSGEPGRADLGVEQPAPVGS